MQSSRSRNKQAVNVLDCKREGGGSIFFAPMSVKNKICLPECSNFSPDHNIVHLMRMLNPLRVWLRERKLPSQWFQRDRLPSGRPDRIVPAAERFHHADILALNGDPESFSFEGSENDTFVESVQDLTGVVIFAART